MIYLRRSSFLVLFLALSACSADDTATGSRGAGGGAASSGAGGEATGGGGKPSSGSGAGGELFPTGSGGATGAGGSVDCGNELLGTVRDFMVAHPDFEDFLGDDKGIVSPDLGADGKPVYAGNPTTPTTTGKENFDQWFRDVDGVNMAIPHKITLTPSGGVSTYDNSNFFPIDGKGFGDEGNTHNYHFTYEIRTKFEYKGGEVFTFTGDDDLFTYINGKLAINLGGVHGAQSETVNLDAMAQQLGIEKGKTYSLDFFFAERHTSESNFRIDTTITCFTPPPPQ
jgi:fibro-slime domain-containing protein